MGAPKGHKPPNGWKPGQSGNPNGRPKGAYTADVRALFRERADIAIAALVDVCMNSKSPSARVAAANSILDRGYGKPVQQIIQTEIQTQKADLSKLTREEVKLYMELVAKSMPDSLDDGQDNNGE